MSPIVGDSRRWHAVFPRPPEDPEPLGRSGDYGAGARPGGRVRGEGGWPPRHFRGQSGKELFGAERPDAPGILPVGGPVDPGWDRGSYGRAVSPPWEAVPGAGCGVDGAD